MASTRQIAAYIALASAILVVLVHAAVWIDYESVSASPDLSPLLFGKSWPLAPLLTGIGALGALVAMFFANRRDVPYGVELPADTMPGRVIRGAILALAICILVSTIFMALTHGDSFIIFVNVVAFDGLLATAILLITSASKQHISTYVTLKELKQKSAQQT